MDDLENWIDPDPTGERRMYVIDSHRPLNLDNVYNSEQVIIFDDGELEAHKDEEEAYKKIQEINETLEIEGEDLDDDEDDEENFPPADDSDEEKAEEERKRREKRRRGKVIAQKIWLIRFA